MNNLIEFIKKNKITMLAVIIFPILLIIGLKLIYRFAPWEEIGSADGWIGFLGGYTGGIIALIGIWWQLEESKKLEEFNKVVGLKKYILYILNHNSNSKNAEITTEDVNFGIQALISYQTLSIKGDYKPYTQFCTDFINQNLKIIMELDLGEKLLDIDRKIQETNKMINTIFSEANERKFLIKNIENFLLEKNNGKVKYGLIDNLEIIKHISNMVYLYNKNGDFKDNKINYRKNEIKRISIQNDGNVLAILPNAKELINKVIKLDYRVKSEKTSIELNELLIKIAHDFNDSMSGTFNEEYEEFYRKFLKYLFDDECLNGVSFELLKEIEALKLAIKL